MSSGYVFLWKSSNVRGKNTKISWFELYPYTTIWRSECFKALGFDTSWLSWLVRFMTSHISTGKVSYAKASWWMAQCVPVTEELLFLHVHVSRSWAKHEWRFVWPKPYLWVPWRVVLWKADTASGTFAVVMRVSQKWQDRISSFKLYLRNTLWIFSLTVLSTEIRESLVALLFPMGLCHQQSNFLGLLSISLRFKDSFFSSHRRTPSVCQDGLSLSAFRACGYGQRATIT